MTLLAQERATYDEMWSLEGYADHAPGEYYLPIFLQMVGTQRGTVLDAGTGSGKGGVALAREGFKVKLCDVSRAGLVADAQSLPYGDACLWHDLSSLVGWLAMPGRTTFDYVYCTDVLEHLPPQFTMLAIDQMLRVARKGLFLTVSLVPDSFGVWAGKSLHLTVESFVWWRDSLRELGEVVEARDLHNSAAFFVRPR